MMRSLVLSTGFGSLMFACSGEGDASSEPDETAEPSSTLCAERLDEYVADDVCSSPTMAVIVPTDETFVDLEDPKASEASRVEQGEFGVILGPERVDHVLVEVTTFGTCIVGCKFAPPPCSAPGNFVCIDASLRGCVVCGAVGADETISDVDQYCREIAAACPAD